MFQIEKIPILLTVLFTFVGLQYNYLVNSVTKTPTVEYRLKASDKKEAGKSITSEMTCDITNISSSSSFSDLDLTIAFKSSEKYDSVYDPEIIAINPSSILGNERNTAGNSAFFKINRLQPGMKYQLTFKTNSGEENLPLMYLSTKETVRLVPSSIWTYLVRNSFELNFVLLVLFVLFSVIYLFKIK